MVGMNELWWRWRCCNQKKKKKKMQLMAAEWMHLGISSSPSYIILVGFLRPAFISPLGWISSEDVPSHLDSFTRSFFLFSCLGCCCFFRLFCLSSPGMNGWMSESQMMMLMMHGLASMELHKNRGHLNRLNWVGSVFPPPPPDPSFPISFFSTDY